MGVQIRQANTSIFDQLMERLDGLNGNTSAAPPASTTAPPVPLAAPPVLPAAPPVISTVTPLVTAAVTPITGVIPSSGIPSIPYVAPTPLNVLSRWS